jgi:hypothetical protein
MTMRTGMAAVAATTLVLALGACGQSSADKAKSTVCDARSDISKQIDALKSLTPSTISKDAVTQPLGAIKSDLGKIRDAQSELSGDRRSQVQSANQAFTSSLQKISGEFLRSLSASEAGAQLKQAAQQLEAAYKSALAPISCD